MFENFLGKAAEIVSKGADILKTGAKKVKEAQDNIDIISEEHPLRTVGLEVYPNKLRYKKQTFYFTSITHIKIEWKSTSTNDIINMQNVKVSIVIDNDKLIEVSNYTMYITPKLVKAYNFIAQKTFDSRLKFYTNQLEKRGYFNLEECTYYYIEEGLFGNKQKIIDGHARVYTDGRILFKDKKMSLFDATIDRTEIYIDINDELFTASTNFNNDIIFALISFILENPQSPDEYINNFKQQKNSQNIANDFIFNSLSLMAKLSYADGVISPEEIEVIEDFILNTMDIDRSKISQIMIIFHQAKNSPQSFEYFATNLFNKYDTNLLYIILDILFLIAIADGTISAEEELLLLEAETIFGIKGTMFSEFKTQLHTEESNQREYYLKILGLELNATQNEIKKTYRRLAMKFHPDRVIHLGEDFFKEAEKKMKEINEAYEYLKNL